MPSTGLYVARFRLSTANLHFRTGSSMYSAFGSNSLFVVLLQIELTIRFIQP